MINISDINEKIKLIDEYLESLFDDKDSLLLDSIKYSLFAGGKRLRPLIMLFLAEELSVSHEKILPFCASVEMIHTYSLIHDDLPCLDNDDLRRNKPTNHIVFGENFALLAGDGLLNFAHEVMLNSINDETGIKASRMLSSSAGLFGMISGQVLDVFYENNDITKEELLIIHENKTGKLLAACFAIPFILAKQSEEKQEFAYKLGLDYGLSFQILDDILDVTSSQEILGKPIGSDDKNNKKTYVSLFGLENANNDYENLKNKCLFDIKKLFGEDSRFYDFIKFTFDRKK